MTRILTVAVLLLHLHPSLASCAPSQCTSDFDCDPGALCVRDMCDCDGVDAPAGEKESDAPAAAVVKEGKEGKQRSAAPEGKEGKQTSAAQEGKEGKQTSAAQEGKEGKQTSAAPEGKEGRQTSAPEGKEGKQTSAAPEGKEGKQTSAPEGKEGKQTSAAPEGKTSTPRFRAASPPPYPTMLVTKVGSSSAVAPSRTLASQDFVLKVGGLDPTGCSSKGTQKAQFGVASHATLLLTNKKGQDRDISGASVDKLIAALRESKLNWFTWCQRKDNGNMYFTATATGKGKDLKTGKTKDIKSEHAMTMCGESTRARGVRCSVWIRWLLVACTDSHSLCVRKRE